MSYDARIESLRSKHTALDTALQEEGRRPIPNPTVVSDLKRQKLRLKDEIERMALA